MLKRGITVTPRGCDVFATVRRDLGSGAAIMFALEPAECRASRVLVRGAYAPGSSGVLAGHAVRGAAPCRGDGVGAALRSVFLDPSADGSKNFGPSAKSS